MGCDLNLVVSICHSIDSCGQIRYKIESDRISVLCNGVEIFIIRANKILVKKTDFTESLLDEDMLYAMSDNEYVLIDNNSNKKKLCKITQGILKENNIKNPEVN